MNKTKYLILLNSVNDPQLVDPSSVEVGYLIECGVRALAGKKSRAQIFTSINKDHVGISL